MATWEGDSLRREVFFFDSGPHRLYGSLYASARRTHPGGVVLCSSWGIEADRTQDIVHGLAAEAADLGGAAVVFHYPGYGDSGGRIEDVTIEDLVAAAVRAAAEGSRREPGTSWVLAGLMLGASVAALAWQRVAARGLLLVQPALDPGAYFEQLLHRVERAGLVEGKNTDTAFGYPVPEAIRSAGPDVAAAVGAELVACAGPGAVVRYAEPKPDEALPEGFDAITAPGSWRFGSMRYPDLARAAVTGLHSVLRGIG
ncbi:hypothetical protein BH20GEM1_BH20GEM1_21390 [soil metagenome]